MAQGGIGQLAAAAPYPNAALDIRQPTIRPAPIQLPTLPAVTTPPLADWNLPNAGNTGTDWGQAGMNTLAGLMTGQAVAKALGFDPLGAVGKGISSAWDSLVGPAGSIGDVGPSAANIAAEWGSGGGGIGAEAAGGVVPAAAAAYPALSGTPALATAPTAAQQAASAALTQADTLAELAALQSGVATAAPATGAAGLAGANVGAGLTPAAVEAMTGLSTAAPVAAGAIGAGTGALAGGVAGGMGGAAGAGLGGMAAGSYGTGAGFAGLGGAATLGALAAPLAAYGIMNSMSLGGNFKPAYDYSANSLVPKLATYEAAQLGREIPALPAMDQLAAADMIAKKIGLDPATVGQQVPMYNQSRPQVAAKLAEIMARENRYPTPEEFLQAVRDVGTPPPSPFTPGSGAAYKPVWNGSQWVQSSQYPGGVFEPR